MRKCPNCNNSISFWSVIKPGLWKDKKIKCTKCNKEISEYWAKTNILIWLFLGVATIIFIELLNSIWYLELLYLFSFYAILLVLVYFLIPFKKVDKWKYVITSHSSWFMKTALLSSPHFFSQLSLIVRFIKIKCTLK